MPEFSLIHQLQMDLRNVSRDNKAKYIVNNKVLKFISHHKVLDKFINYNISIIIDGNFSLNYKNINEKSVIGGDKLSLSIAAASIIAKVHRDRLMGIYDSKFMNYGWKKNSGYGTKQHINAIYENGITVHHRKTFEPIKSLSKKF